MTTDPITLAWPWFPPGLPDAQAEWIAAQWWEVDPHWAAYLAWTAWAATLAPTVPVSSVGTGSQTVSYSPASPSGDLGAALARADWHRAQSSFGGLTAVPLASPGRLRLLSYDEAFERGA